MSLLLNDSYKDNCYLQNGFFCTPLVIKKSSVGEFYTKTIGEIINSVASLPISPQSKALLLPLAVGREVGDEYPDKVL